jgi:hypothetical protein
MILPDQHSRSSGAPGAYRRQVGYAAIGRTGGLSPARTAGQPGGQGASWPHFPYAATFLAWMAQGARRACPAREAP